MNALMQNRNNQSHKDRQQARKQASELLNELGVGDRLDHGTAMLSGEQQQRVAAVVLAA